MGEDVGLLPAGEIEFGAGREKIETGLGEVRASLTGQHRVQHRLKLVQIGDIVGGIGELFFGQFLGAPVG